MDFGGLAFEILLMIVSWTEEEPNHLLVNALIGRYIKSWNTFQRGEWGSEGSAPGKSPSASFLRSEQGAGAFLLGRSLAFGRVEQTDTCPCLVSSA